MAETFRTPEGALIRAEIDRAGMSVRAVAREIPISDTQLRAWYRGADNRGTEVHFPARQLARTARALNLRPAQLREVGRDDAAEILQTLAPAPEAKTYTQEEVSRLLDGMAKRIGELEDEIERIVDASEG